MVQPDSLIFRVKRRKSRGGANENKEDIEEGKLEIPSKGFTFTKKKMRLDTNIQLAKVDDRNSEPIENETIQKLPIIKSTTTSQKCSNPETENFNGDSLLLCKAFSRYLKAEMEHLREDYGGSRISISNIITEISEALKTQFHDFLTTHKPITTPDIILNPDNAILRATTLELNHQLERLKNERDLWLNLLDEATSIDTKNRDAPGVDLKVVDSTGERTQTVEQSAKEMGEDELTSYREITDAALENCRANVACVESSAHSFQRLVNLARRKRGYLLDAFHQKHFSAYGDVTKARNLIKAYPS